MAAVEKLSPAGRVAKAYGCMMSVLSFLLLESVPHMQVAPVTWQKAMLAEYHSRKAPAGASKSQKDKARKMRSVLLCNSRWPWLRMTYKDNDSADALLLARYGYKKWKE
jgi:hypothetical protein